MLGGMRIWKTYFPFGIGLDTSLSDNEEKVLACNKYIRMISKVFEWCWSSNKADVTIVNIECAVRQDYKITIVTNPCNYPSILLWVKSSVALKMATWFAQYFFFWGVVNQQSVILTGDGHLNTIMKTEFNNQGEDDHVICSFWTFNRQGSQRVISETH